MKPVYCNSGLVEKAAKKKYKFPENLMMENAAAALENSLQSFNTASRIPTVQKVLILCGKGNNGGDGLALARRLSGDFKVFVYLAGEPKTDEAKLQMLMTKSLPVNFISIEETFQLLKNLETSDFIVDCLFGTGFYGQLPDSIKNLLENCNKTNAVKIACDIPSGLVFNADKTVTMGALKTILFTDKAKDKTGKIDVADLGITEASFVSASSITPDAFLIEESDIKLPYRTDKSAHKGNFGHGVFIAGEKSGAGIIAATAALNFGAGLVSLVKTENSNLEQFKISPELMVGDRPPEKTTALAMGSGLGEYTPVVEELIENWINKSQKRNVCLDADLFSCEKLPSLLEKLNQKDNQVVLTPHLKEFVSLCKLLKIGNIGDRPLNALVDGLESEKGFEDAVALKIRLGKELVEKYPFVTLVIKSANTIICTSVENHPEAFICTAGTPSLAKAGSGDVLCGIITALLAQGYSGKDAAITGVMAHGMAGASFDEGTGFDLTPLKLIKKLGEVTKSHQ